MSKDGLSDEDKRAWRAVTRHVRPLSGRKGRQAEQPRPQPISVSVDRSASGATPNVRLPQKREGDRKIRRGQQAYSASLDLHGHTQSSAWHVLPAFLQRQRASGARCVIVITGKGVSGEGVLRRNFLRWMEMPEAAQHVTGFSEAHPKHGGSGAFYVFLRRL